MMFVNKQFKMEMAQTDNGNTPRNYSLNMFQDFVPMCVFSESNQGNNYAAFYLSYDFFTCISFIFLIEHVETSCFCKRATTKK